MLAFKWKIMTSSSRVTKFYITIIIIYSGASYYYNITLIADRADPARCYP